jgi:hypothetical protein
MDVSMENKMIAKIARDAFGGVPNVYRYWNSDNSKYIDILSCQDTPHNGIISFSTIGLSQYDQEIVSNSKPLRVEIVGASSKETECFPNIVAYCAFTLCNRQQKLFPGAILQNVIQNYLTDVGMKHILLVPPFLWDEKLKTIDLNDKYIAWLLTVPISDEECRFAMHNSSDELESVFEKKSIDVFDINRKSAL